MGSSQSSHAKYDVENFSVKKSSSSPSVRGRKSIYKGRFSAPHGLTASIVSIPSEHLRCLEDLDHDDDHDITAAETAHSDDVHLHEYQEELCDEETESESEEEEEEEEEKDEEWEERLRILEDARKLKQVAEFFLHPEQPVAPSLGTRCFFDRCSAPKVLTEDEFHEQDAILADAAVLKKLAVDYLHPEVPVVTTDAFPCGRNFYSRPSASEQETFEEAEERAAIMEDLKALKQADVDYMHPELSVVGTGASARNFFSRASAPEMETQEEAEERIQILRDAEALKEVAGFFMHPEVPVVTSDDTACGRNYFSRASAPECETEDDAEEREQIMNDLKALKQAAVDFLHPEIPVAAMDATACGRNYFVRFSAPDQVSLEEVEERAHILNDLEMLKQAAADYLHPERSVVSTDATACERNYFARASAPERLSKDQADERAHILADATALKKSAGAYMHPEFTVVTTDATVYGRNYFNRASAPEPESLEDAEIRAQILQDAEAFKQLATDFMHPELPVVIYTTATGRNYFSRVTVPEYESLEDAEARAQVMEDLKAFKKFAVDFLHPELPVASADAAAFGRDFFNRASAPKRESTEEEKERAAIFADVADLKQGAVDYMHPELPVVVYATVTGRNFFTRPSAPDQESLEEAEERERIMEDLMALKRAAKDYLHPELSVVTNDACAFGRNYFSRASAPEQDSFEDAEERAAIMADLKALKQVAVDYMYPEHPVVGASACARNYFSRSSAPEYDTAEGAEERAAILEDLKALKQAAVNFMHPELPIKTTDATACGRNYFSRFSASQSETPEESEERAEILADAAAIKQAAVAYMHPELPVVGAEACARNYFDRPSSALHYQMIHTFAAHDDDWSDHHHEHIDHFGMDEEMEVFADLRQELAEPIEQNRTKAYAGSDVGSNLSRSPSSVMLFGMDDIYD